MSNLAVEFSIRMRKRAAGSEGEPTLISLGKWSRRSSPDEEAQKD